MPNVKQPSSAVVQSKPSIGIALGGGGPLGGVYEIGALRALDEALEGLNFNDLDVYVGVNSGSFVAANLCNQLTPAQMCRIFVRNEADVHPFHPDVFYRPAFSEYIQRAKAVPGLLTSALSNLLSNPNDQSLLEALTVLAQAVPSGLFDNEGFHEYLSRSYSTVGRTNDFKLLKKKLLVIATDLATGETVRFGEEATKHVPISKAIQSSMAAPGLYTPVALDGHHYMDGTMNKGMHTSVALENGADVVFAINPVVPIDALRAVAQGQMGKDDLVNAGMPNVLAQSYRTMVHSRLQSGLKTIEREYPDASVLLFEPSRDDAKLFLSSVFSFKARKMMCERAYQITRAELISRADELEKVLSPAGIRIRHDILEDEYRTLSTGLYGETLPVYEGKGSLFKKPQVDALDDSYWSQLSQKVSNLV